MKNVNMEASCELIQSFLAKTIDLTKIPETVSGFLNSISSNLHGNESDLIIILQSLTGIRSVINILAASKIKIEGRFLRTLHECTGIFREILVSKLKLSQNDHVFLIIKEICATIGSEVYFESPDGLIDFLCEVFDVFLLDFTNDSAEIECIEERMVKLGAIFKNFSAFTHVKIAQNLQYKLREILNGLIDLTKHTNTRICSVIVYEILPQIEDNIIEDTESATKLWEVVCDFFDVNDNGYFVENNPNGFLILCGIADKLFPSAIMPYKNCNFLDVRKSQQLWLIIQNGLVHSNPMTRKSSMHLLKRALESSCKWTEQEVPFLNLDSLFWWLNTESHRLQKCYEDLILILETLEEKQAHIIKPMLPKIVTLRQAAHLCPTTAGNATFYLHTSWLLVVFERLLKHDNVNTKKLGISEIATVDLDAFPLFAQKMEKFVFHVIIPSLNDTSLFVRQQEQALSSCPLIGENVAYFFANCYKSLDQHARKEFFKKVLHCLCQQSWGSVPLLYICRGIALLPKDAFWGSEDLARLRELVVISSRTQEIPIRTAIQHYILQSMIASTDIKSVQVEDLVNLLATFNCVESLHRGTAIWDRVAEWFGDSSFGNEWLQSNINFCIRSFDINAQGSYSGNPQSTIRFMCLLADSKIISIARLKSLFEPIIYTLQTTSGRCYMPIERADTCLQFLMSFWHTSRRKLVQNDLENDELHELSESLLAICRKEICDYIVKRIFGDRKEMKELPDLDLYFQFLNYEAKQEILPSPPEFTSVIERDPIQKYVHVKWMTLQSEYILQSQSIPKISKNQILDILEEMIRNEWLTISLPVIQLDSTSELDVANWAKRVTDHQCNLWTCAKLYFQNRRDNKYINSAVQQSTIALETGGIESLSAIFSTLELVLPRVLEDNVVTEVLNHCWRCIFEYKRSKIFWIALKSLICTMYQPRFISHPFDKMLAKFAMDMCKESESCNGLFLPLVQHMCSTKLQLSILLSSETFLTIMVSSLTFGPVHRKDQRVFRDAIDFLITLVETDMLELIECHHVDHLLVRVTAICFLLKLDPSQESHVTFADTVIEKLLDEDKCVTQSRSRHFGNSLIHRIKTRCWQSILLISPFMSLERAELVYDVAVHILIDENLQTSVRYLIEWLVSRILFRFENLLELFWDTVHKASEKRVGSLVAFFNVIKHLIRLGMSNDTFNMENFSLRVFTEIFPWCMSQHSNTRTSAQILFQKLWDVNKRLQLTAHLEKFEAIHRGVESAIKFGYQKNKNSQNSQDDFYSTFNPNGHFTIQTLFYELPRLSNITDEEWIAPGLFTRILERPHTNYIIPVINCTDELSKCEPSSCVTKYGEMDALDVFSGCEPFQDFGDFQKKVTPWKQMWKDPEALQCMLDSQIAKKKLSKDGGLVVVASLVDRAPNLGGLCRTCEVLGASEYIINSLKTIQEKQFNNLSVSSERWLPIREVKVHQLKHYLTSMKHSGYTLIGAEQTAQSVPLTTLQFPRKTLILLGNEKEGIPVDLIQILDVCVEIPQTGVIRSLNVHVSGAILIWEYARQHP